MGAGVFERVARDLLAPRAADDLQALDHLVGLAVLDAGVEVFLVLADDDDVHHRMLGGDERGIGRARPDIGIQPERLADGDVEALESAPLGRRDRRLVEHLRPPQAVPGLRRDACGVAREIDALPDVDRLEGEPGTCRDEDLQARLHDLGADSVAKRHGHRRAARSRPLQGVEKRRRIVMRIHGRLTPRNLAFFRPLPLRADRGR